MNKTVDIFKITAKVISIVCLYLSSAFMALEFITLVLTNKLPIELAIKPLFLSAVLLVLSFVVKKHNPSRFTNTKVYNTLSIILALSLSMFLVSFLDRNFEKIFQEAVSTFERDGGINFVKSLSFLGMGIFFLTAIPLVFLMGLKEGSNKLIKTSAGVLFWLISGFILYLIWRYDAGEWETLFVNKYVIPLVQFLIGSLSIGWFYELYVSSLEKSG